MRTPKFLALALLATIPSLAAGQRGLDTARGVALGTRIPVDPKVKIGTLPNGLRYYIRQNQKPEKRAELRLVVNAGSVLEKDSQRGYAHFVEHMGFNGSRHFAKNDLVKYLQSIGVRFGADLNAYTGFDETVYILPIPTDTQRIVDQAFTILEDWAHGVLFDPAEAIAERGVILEEWRGRKGANDRMLNQWLPVLLKGSAYANRIPIGTEQTITGATGASLREFYRDWYRPDLMAVVAVGDFDPAQIEAKIKQHFSGLRTPANAPKRPVPPIPGNQTPLIAITSDKEATSTQALLFFKLPRDSANTTVQYRQGLMEELYLAMFNGRLSEISQKPNAPFIGAGASKGGFIGRTTDPFSLAAIVQDGAVERGLEALLVEAKRVDQFGFLQSELDRAKTNMLRGYERANAERDKTNSDGYAEEYVRVYLEGEATPGIEWEYATVQQMLPGITLAEVNRLASGWITEENRALVVMAPQKEGVALPTEASLLAIFDKAAKAPVVAYTETLSGDALVDNVRPAGTVTASKARPAGVSEWALSNGARVLVKPTDFKADQILFGAYSPGGVSNVADADFMSAVISTQVSGLSGLGQFNAIDLQKKLAGKAASAGAQLTEQTEELRGTASPKDLETLMQLVYLRFTGLRFDSTAFEAFRNNVQPFLANRGASPEATFSDTMQVTLAQYDFRARPLTPATFAEVNGPKAVEFLKERFANAGDFTFVFVGNIDTVALRPLVERYLASLPATNRVDAPRVTGKGLPTGIIQKTVRKGVEPKAQTVIAFSGPCVSTPENRVAIRAMVDLLQLRLDETLREKLGGTYSPSIGGGCNRVPRQEYLIRVQYNSAPDNVESLSQAVFGIIDSLKKTPPSEAEVVKVREQIIRGREVELKTNNYWLTQIMAREQAGEDIGGLGAPYDQLVLKVTPQMIQAAARQYLNANNYARFLLLPATP